MEDKGQIRDARDLSRRERLEVCIVLALNEHLLLSAPLAHEIIGGSVDMQPFKVIITYDHV